MKNRGRDTEAAEKAFLVGLELPGSDRWGVKDSLEELALLAATAGAEVKGETITRRRAPAAATCIGRGKAEEVARIVREGGIDLVLFDEDLTPAQLRNLQDVMGARVLDRTELILAIFAQRARTREAQLQIEMAQLHYLLPRLTGKGVLLSRLGGGIGTKGPGETKLEVDRRKIRDRIHHLKEELEKVRRHRSSQRRQRRETGIMEIAIIGYTNSGKSTLLNALTGADAAVENKLFATLDPTTRRAKLPSGLTVLFYDTVGFIKKLPHHLVESFRATLEEVAEADILLQVMDASHRLLREQNAAVEQVLAELKIGSKTVIPVLNKADLVRDPFRLDELAARLPGSVAVSALNRTGFDALLRRIDAALGAVRRRLRLLVPQGRPDLVAWLHQKGTVVKTDYHQNDVYIEVMLEDRWRSQVKEYLL
ncbi:MAG: GTPase HflX [Candidatus Aureabacteria bacterium]|nr:GTPase HflX [Candidatus Auribacterota bacterium]